MLCITCVCEDVEAKNFGVYGNTFTINETDLLEVISSKLQELDVEKWQKDFINRVQRSINRPSSIELPQAIESRTFYYDPSIRLKHNYKDHKGFIFARRGQVINPLDYVVMSQDLIFIDGDIEKQVSFAINYYNKHQTLAKIILVKGSALELILNKNIRVYFDQGGILVKRFNLKALPSIISQEGKLLKIEEVCLDYD